MKAISAVIPGCRKAWENGLGGCGNGWGWWKTAGWDGVKNGVSVKFLCLKMKLKRDFSSSGGEGGKGMGSLELELRCSFSCWEWGARLGSVVLGMWVLGVEQESEGLEAEPG